MPYTLQYNIPPLPSLPFSTLHKGQNHDPMTYNQH